VPDPPSKSQPDLERYKSRLQWVRDFVYERLEAASSMMDREVWKWVMEDVENLIENVELQMIAEGE